MTEERLDITELTGEDADPPEEAGKDPDPTDEEERAQAGVPDDELVIDDPEPGEVEAEEETQ